MRMEHHDAMSGSEKGRSMAPDWPYPCRQQFERELQRAATAWFETKGLPRHPRYPYCLAEWEQWPCNVILPEVAEYVQRVKREVRSQRAAVPTSQVGASWSQQPGNAVQPPGAADRAPRHDSPRGGVRPAGPGVARRRSEGGIRIRGSKHLQRGHRPAHLHRSRAR